MPNAGARCEHDLSLALPLEAMQIPHYSNLILDGFPCTKNPLMLYGLEFIRYYTCCVFVMRCCVWHLVALQTWPNTSLIGAK